MRLALLALLVAASPALAQDPDPLPKWEPAPDAASAAIARLGASTLLSSSTALLPDGRIGLLTFWDVPGLGRYRCVDFLDAGMQPLSDAFCTRPVRRPN